MDDTDDPLFEARRDRMAIACIPSVHRRLADKTIGVKEVAQMAAESVGNGRFRSSVPPTNPSALT